MNSSTLFGLSNLEEIMLEIEDSLYAMEDRFLNNQEIADNRLALQPAPSQQDEITITLTLFVICEIIRSLSYVQRRPVLRFVLLWVVCTLFGHLVDLKFLDGAIDAAAQASHERGDLFYGVRCLFAWLGHVIGVT